MFDRLFRPHEGADDEEKFFWAVLRILNRLVPILHRLCSVGVTLFLDVLLFTLTGRMTPLGGRKTKSDFRNEKHRIDYPYRAETTREMPFFVLKQACAFRLLNAQIYHNQDPLFGVNQQIRALIRIKCPQIKLEEIIGITKFRWKHMHFRRSQGFILASTCLKKLEFDSRDGFSSVKWT